MFLRICTLWSYFRVISHILIKPGMGNGADCCSKKINVLKLPFLLPCSIRFGLSSLLRAPVRDRITYTDHRCPKGGTRSELLHR